MPEKLKKLLKFLYFNLIHRGAKAGYIHYTESDEKRKFEHLVEVVNYTRVIQEELVVFEFGCHSGHVFHYGVCGPVFKTTN